MADAAKRVEQAYTLAKERYGELGVDTDAALSRLSRVPISLPCWQGDDVTGFEGRGDPLGGGLAVTGSFPGRAATPEQLRCDLEEALSLIPGSHRLSLHASYAETDGQEVERNELEGAHFQSWIDWAKENGLGIDFNPTFFAHPMAASGFTLAHADEGIRRFWIEHGVVCRRIGAAMGRALATPCVTNIWIADGYKDTPVDRKSPRLRLSDSLDRIFAEPIDSRWNLDAVESKLFGIGSESYVVGSHEFYLGYAVAKRKLLCLDVGHFHPTESVCDKLSSVLMWLDAILLHVSRPVRWDSDHVVTLTDQAKGLAQELVRGNFLDRVHIGLDFFDASINRIAAWVIGTRATLQSLLLALLEPIDLLRGYELEGDFTSRLAILEELKMLPSGAIWDYYCLQAGVPVADGWLQLVKKYEKNVLTNR